MKKKALYPPLQLSILKTAIITLRNYQVMLDRDLAIFYQVETRALKQAVKRNSERFPFDFMFQVTEEEVDLMVSQNVIPNKQVLGGSLPFAFTEQGIASLSAVLKSKRAAEVHVPNNANFRRNASFYNN